MTARNAFIITAALAVAAVAIVGASRLLRPPAAELPQITVYCGTSMRPAAEEIAAEFQKRHRIFVQFNFGGSETLFPQIKLSREGDIFVCHDPFGDDLKKEGLLARAETVGFLDPVIIVPPGNPKKIGSLKDLMDPKLRVGTTDPRYATCGKLVEDKIREHGWAEGYTDPPFVLQSRSHSDVATPLVAGHLDAGIVWNFAAESFRGKVESMPTGESFPETRVTICLLTCSKQSEAAAKFLDVAGSEYGRQVFVKHGYARQSVATTEGAGKGG